jgi:short subunit dehydrogenase-like uncharacterized protein
MNTPQFDVVVYGATGFAGALTAEYLQDTVGAEVRWAVAGRSEDKLKRLVSELAERRPSAPPVAYIVADSTDRASLDALVAQTKVVCTTVGPYAQYGAGLVAAAAAAGTHYCDLTGEPQFVRRMVDAHHAEAQQSGARIVHCAGFDSIPSDLGTLVVQTAAIEADGEPCDEVEFVLLGGKGGFSGGTLASLINVVAEAKDPAVRRVLADPYSLCEGSGSDIREQMGVRYSGAAKAWTGPFLMAGINERVVRRSNELLSHRYGTGFRYGESMRTGRGITGWTAAAAMAGGFGVMMPALFIGPVRRLISRFLTQPGDGPSRDDIENGFFKARVYAKRNGKVVHTVTVTGSQDPGYGATACMLAETALGLAAGQGLGEPGVTTPAAALGMGLVERLNAHRVTFTLED